jgi:hypothetical protein
VHHNRPKVPIPTKMMPMKKNRVLKKGSWGSHALPENKMMPDKTAANRRVMWIRSFSNMDRTTQFPVWFLLACWTEPLGLDKQS